MRLLTVQTETAFATEITKVYALAENPSTGRAIGYKITKNTSLVDSLRRIGNQAIEKGMPMSWFEASRVFGPLLEPSDYDVSGS